MRSFRICFKNVVIHTKHRIVLYRFRFSESRVYTDPVSKFIYLLVISRIHQIRNSMTHTITYLFWAVAFVFSLFYGISAREIFVENQASDKPFSWKFHQFWFNFLGAATGWILLWCAIPKILYLFNFQENADFSLSDGLLVLLSFIGITGHLPLTLWGVITSAKELVGKLFSSR